MTTKISLRFQNLGWRHAYFWPVHCNKTLMFNRVNACGGPKSQVYEQEKSSAGATARILLRCLWNCNLNMLPSPIYPASDYNMFLVCPRLLVHPLKQVRSFETDHQLWCLVSFYVRFWNYKFWTMHTGSFSVWIFKNIGTRKYLIRVFSKDIHWRYGQTFLLSNHTFSGLQSTPSV